MSNLTYGTAIEVDGNRSNYKSEDEEKETQDKAFQRAVDKAYKEPMSPADVARYLESLNSDGQDNIVLDQRTITNTINRIIKSKERYGLSEEDFYVEGAKSKKSIKPEITGEFLCLLTNSYFDKRNSNE